MAGRPVSLETMLRDGVPPNIAGGSPARSAAKVATADAGDERQRHRRDDNVGKETLHAQFPVMVRLSKKSSAGE